MFLFLIAGIIILLYFRTYQDLGVRRSLIKTYLLFVVLAAAVTEILSVFDLITRSTTLLVWGLIAAVFLFLLTLRIRETQIQIKDLVELDIRSKLATLSKIEILIIVTIGVILATTLVIAILSPPNNYDSMTYHMARVSHWIQNQNVKYYPTAIDRQNYSAPLAEFVILQLQIVSRSDRYANLVQWSAFVFLIILASQVAAELKTSRKGQFFAGLFAATIPMAILQSTSTQNDLFTAVGCLSFYYFLSRSVREGKWQDLVFAGFSLGIAVMTKGTGYIYCAGIGLTLGLSRLFSRQTKNHIALIRNLALVILIALVMNLGVYLRNWNAYSSPLPTESGQVRTEELTIEGLYVNLVRNGLVQLALPFKGVNQSLTEGADRILGELNSDPSYLYFRSPFEIRFVIDEDLASNLLHFLIILGGIAAYSLIKEEKDKDLGWLILTILVSTFLYSLTIKWQPWGSRLQLPVYLLGAPLLGFLIDRAKTSKIFPILTLTLLAVYSIPYLVLNSSRPLVPIFHQKSPLRMDKFISSHPLIYDLFSDLIQPYYADTSVLYTPRRDQYFTANQRIQGDYIEVMSAVNNLDLDILGLEFHRNSWEYPIWVYLDTHARVGSPKVVHVGLTGDLEDGGLGGEEWPVYIISGKGEDSYFLQEQDYRIIVDTEILDLLVR